MGIYLSHIEAALIEPFCPAGVGVELFELIALLVGGTDLVFFQENKTLYHPKFGDIFI